MHLDRTPCSDKCIANDHYGRHPDFPEDNPTESHVTPSKDATPVNEKEAADMEKNTDSLQELQTKSDDITQYKEISPQLSVPMTVPETVNAGPPNTTDSVMPANTEENVDDGITTRSRIKTHRYRTN